MYNFIIAKFENLIMAKVCHDIFFMTYFSTDFIWGKLHLKQNRDLKAGFLGSMLKNYLQKKTVLDMRIYMEEFLCSTYDLSLV